MTGEQTKTAMYNIAAEKAAQYAKQLSELDPTKVMEKKALAISKQISQNCATFTKIEYKERFYEVREMRVYGQSFHDFDEWKPLYNSLTGDDRESFLVFSYSVIMVRHCLLNKREEQLAALDGTGNVQKQFEAKIIVGVIDDILRDWQKFWNENGCVPCEVIK